MTNLASILSAWIKYNLTNLANLKYNYYKILPVTNRKTKVIENFGKNEWNKMMDAWVYFCFKIDGFEIFLTETKGLGKI